MGIIITISEVWCIHTNPFKTLKAKNTSFNRKITLIRKIKKNLELDIPQKIVGLLTQYIFKII